MFAQAVDRICDLGTATPAAPGVLGKMPDRLATLGIQL
jgi:hypothetical protein